MVNHTENYIRKESIKEYKLNISPLKNVIKQFKLTNNMTYLFNAMLYVSELYRDNSFNYFCTECITEEEFDKWEIRIMKIKNYIHDLFIDYQSGVNQLLFDIKSYEEGGNCNATDK